ncbi:MAG TPA: DnaJ domain-containing protein [Candidatus Polarisedimenticolia bacterium]|nr:DnaJ domain-containing protein [Candidatus Polarisedimenticolia bacterium]
MAGGKLAEQSLVLALGRILRLGRSGALKISRGSTVRQLFIDKGRTIRYAASNLMAESLSEHLKQKGRFNPDQMRRATAAKQSSELLGSALVRLGFLSADEHKAMVREMIQRVLLSASRWEDAAYEYQEGELPFSDPDDAGVSLGIAILDLARQATDLNRLKSALGEGDSRVRLNTAPPLPLDQVPLSPAEGFLVSRADGTLTVREIALMSPLGSEETERALCALILSGLLSLDGAESEPGVPGPTRPVAADAPVRVRPAQRPSPAKATRPAGPVEEVLERFAALTGQNLYQILGIQSGASESEIRHAYYSLAKRLHPDKFAEEETKHRAEKLFAAITEAYATLSKPESRQEYDQVLQPVAVKTGPETSSSDLARQNFLHGKAHLERSEMSRALSCFAHAVEQDPAREEYRRYLAITQSRNPRLRREAEQNFIKAIELNPTCAENYALLGLLYRKLGQTARGDEFLQKALGWDPSNETALQALHPESKKGILKGIFGG